jgi:hypothetical protein
MDPWDVERICAQKQFICRGVKALAKQAGARADALCEFEGGKPRRHATPNERRVAPVPTPAPPELALPALAGRQGDVLIRNGEIVS